MFNNGDSRNDFLRKAANAQKLLWGIILFNCLAYFIYPDPVTNPWVLDPEKVKAGEYWLVFTSLFQHADIMHLLMNMYGLWLFGKYTAAVMGWQRFLAVYLISGLTGNILYMLCFWNQPFYLLGASGSVFGITLSLAMLFPEARFGFIFFPAPVKAPTLIIIYTLLEIGSQIFAPGSGVAHLAHLGGFIGAYAALKFLMAGRIEWDPLAFVFRRKHYGNSRQQKFTFHSAADTGTGNAQNQEEDDGSPVSSAEIDFLLAKISNTGVNSLTPREYKRLRRVREAMRSRTNE